MRARRVGLDVYRRLTLGASVAGAALFGAGLVVLVQTQDVPLALALMLAGAVAGLSTAFLQIEGAPQAVPPSLLLYTRKDCALCDEARALLEAMRREPGVEFDLWEADVDADEGLRARYGDSVPVAVAQGEQVFALAYDEARVRAALGLAAPASAPPNP